MRRTSATAPALLIAIALALPLATMPDALIKAATDANAQEKLNLLANSVGWICDVPVLKAFSKCGAYWFSDPRSLALALTAIVACCVRLWRLPGLALLSSSLIALLSGSLALGVVLSLRNDPLAFAPSLATSGPLDVGFWVFLVAVVLLAWQVLGQLPQLTLAGHGQSWLVPALFGAWLIFLWQVVVEGLAVPKILLPPPTMIADQLVAQAGMLWEDFRQTFLKSVLAGFAMGCGLGFIAAVLTDRVPFLQRGLLPLGNMVSAVPIVGIAPIMVMWFGFGWESKAAVIVVMTFFPMLINTIAGLNASDHMSRDLMRSYGSSYWQTFFMLRLPAALPFIFNALKINSTLALIGAIVAEMFGSPISGMGFRISTEVYKMNVDIVWATIAVAAVAGSAFYGLLALIERRLTFWHPSYRSKSYAR